MLEGDISRRRFLELFVGGAAALVACENQTDQEKAKQERENARQRRINEFITRGNLEVLPHESLLIGGNWIDPHDQESVLQQGDMLKLSAEASSEANAPAIDVVVFTGHYPGAQSPDPQHPNAWPIFDVVKHSNNRRYTTSIDVRRLGLNLHDEMQLSFDVVNQAGQVKKAPNGIHIVRYVQRQ